jgi:hypothetical protein
VHSSSNSSGVGSHKCIQTLTLPILASITNSLRMKSVIPGQGCNLQSVAQTCGIHTG